MRKFHLLLLVLWAASCLAVCPGCPGDDYVLPCPPERAALGGDQ